LFQEAAQMIQAVTTASDDAPSALLPITARVQ
jgi:hypothetical protein